MFGRWKSESGATAVEYALLLAILGAGVGLGALNLGNSISNAFDVASAVVSGSASGDDAGGATDPSGNEPSGNHAGGNGKDHAGGNGKDHAGGNGKGNSGN